MTANDAELVTASWISPSEVLGWKLASPEYTAIIGSVTAGRGVVAIAPTKLTPARTAFVVTFTNFTLPVGMPAPGAIAATYAVSTGGAEAELDPDVNTVAVCALATTSVTAAELARAQLP